MASHDEGETCTRCREFHYDGCGHTCGDGVRGGEVSSPYDLSTLPPRGTISTGPYDLSGGGPLREPVKKGKKR